MYFFPLFKKLEIQNVWLFFLAMDIVPMKKQQSFIFTTWIMPENTTTPYTLHLKRKKNISCD